MQKYTESDLRGLGNEIVTNSKDNLTRALEILWEDKDNKALGLNLTYSELTIVVNQIRITCNSPTSVASAPGTASDGTTSSFFTNKTVHAASNTFGDPGTLPK